MTTRSHQYRMIGKNLLSPADSFFNALERLMHQEAPRPTATPIMVISRPKRDANVSRASDSPGKSPCVVTYHFILE